MERQPYRTGETDPSMILLDIFTFTGRMHPLVVHLPIGFLLLAVLFNLLGYVKKFAYLRQAVPLTLLVSFGAAVLACLFGYLLSLKGDYDQDTLTGHKLSGVLLAAVTGLLYFATTPFFLKEIPVPRVLFSVLLVGLVVLMSYSGHQGASLTHGNAYLSMQVLLHQERPKPQNVEDALLYEDVIQPILQAKCTQCHRAGKTKGDLALDDLKNVMKGGKTGPAVIPGRADSGELVRRVMLPENHKDFMPADGKPPLTKNELQLVQWWVSKGNAGAGVAVHALGDSAVLRPLVAQYLGLAAGEAASTADNPSPVNPEIPSVADTAQLNHLRKAGFYVRLMLRKPLMLDVTLPAGSGIKAERCKAALAPLAKNIIWLNLSGNGFTDNDLGFLPSLTNMEKLRLDGNPVTDQISGLLTELKHLEAVNLSGTGITDAGLAALKKNAAIKRVYSWNTMAGR